MTHNFDNSFMASKETKASRLDGFEFISREIQENSNSRRF